MKEKLAAIDVTSIEELQRIKVEQDVVQDRLRALEDKRDDVSQEVFDRVRLDYEGQVRDMGPLADHVDTWLTYEQRVKEIPEWPYTAEIRRNLALSSLLPLLVGLVQGALPELLRRVLPPQMLEVLRWLLPLAW